AGALTGAKRRVLVVDTDLFRPSVLRLLGAHVEAGLPEGVECGLPISDVAVRVLPFGFSLLSTRARVENSIEVLDSGIFRRTCSLSNRIMTSSYLIPRRCSRARMLKSCCVWLMARCWCSVRVQ